MRILRTKNKNYTIVFDINALCVLEEMSGKSLDEVLAQMERSAGLRVIRLMLYAGLQHHYADDVVTEWVAGQIMNAAMEYGSSLKGMAELIQHAVEDGIKPLAAEEEPPAGNVVPALEAGDTASA